MAFLQDIQGFSKNSLKGVATETVSISGRRVRQNPDGLTEVLSEGETGWVADLKPDLQVGEVVPRLFIGSQDVAANLEVLQEHKISHILNVGAMVNNFFPDKFTYCRVEILDIPEADLLSAALPQCIDFIEGALQCNHNVLVHCNAGVSRAASVCIGYIMKQHGKTYEDAHETVKEKRPCIRPNDGFVEQLKKYEAMLIK